MTVRASYFTFGDFGFDTGPSTALREQVRYLIYFVTTYVVEFEDTDIRVAAIDTGMITEVDMHHLIAFSCLLSRLGATPTSALFNRFNTMAVRAAHLALSDLGFDSRPVKAPGKKIRYATGFLPIDMVEFEKMHICLTTIDTRMFGEIGRDTRCVFN